VTAAEVLAILDRLDAAGLEWWIDGGWGVDALLGEQTRPHNDLDFAIREEDLARLAGVLPEFGEVDLHQRPAAYVLRDGQGRELDFHPLAFDAQGDGWQPQADGTRALWPRDAFAARGRIDGREVRCTTPEFQVEAHLYGGYDDLDWAAVELLCERFGLPLPAAGPPGFVQERRPRFER
jgi:lincosamide nucleotidyltransferase A/C/D/E